MATGAETDHEDVPTPRRGRCALCGENYNDFGHNPVPVLSSPEFRVCGDCNTFYVLPVRLGILKLPWLPK